MHACTQGWAGTQDAASQAPVRVVAAASPQAVLMLTSCARSSSSDSSCHRSWPASSTILGRTLLLKWNAL